MQDKWEMDLQLFGEGGGDDPSGDDKNKDDKNKGGDENNGGDDKNKGGDDKNKGGEDTFPRSYVEKLRKDAAEAQRLAKEAQKKLDDLDKEEKKKQGQFEQLAKDAEKRAQEAQDELNAFKAKANQRTINAELKAAAAEYGLIDADLVRLVDMDLVKVNEEGEVEGVKTAFEALKNAKPHLFKEKKTDEEEGSKKRDRHLPPNPGGGDRTPKPKDVRELSDEEFERVWGSAGKKSA